MKKLTAILVLLLMAGTATARIISYWPYATLEKQADLVAVVEVASIDDADDLLTGHGDSGRFQAKTAHLRVGLLVKGTPTEAVDLLYFTYSPAGMAEPNGALFLSLDEPAKHQYLVFLKQEDGKWIPVTGHYDASLSVKVMQQDHFSKIISK